jgi:5-methyltetrahydropteroyltriglutamate--homocysteine methyltransferase
VLTVTKDLVLPATVTGSWPRPRWYSAQLAGRPLSTCLKDVAFREQYTDALSALLDDQERAGLDILTTGDYHHDDTIGGHHWHRYPLERWKGFKGDYFLYPPDLPDMPPGRLLHEIWHGVRWPRIVGKIEANEDNPLEYAKIWRLAQARTSKPVMFGTITAQGLALFLDVEGGPYDRDDRRQIIWDMAELMNHELRQVVAAGCKVIQIEEPMLHHLACFQPERTDLIDFFVDAFNREVEGLGDEVEVWMHTCWGNPNMQRGTDAEDNSYANAIEIYLDRLKADVWTVEMKDAEGKELDLFKPFKNTMTKKIAVGVVSHRTLQVESPAEVAAFARRALESIDLENLILTSDCGFGRQGSNRLVALYKAAAIAQGANIIRRELGLEERDVPITDPARQADAVRETDETRLFGGLVSGASR